MTAGAGKCASAGRIGVIEPCTSELELAMRGIVQRDEPGNLRAGRVGHIDHRDGISHRIEDPGPRCLAFR